jgi:CelD/BcsL family acetyltransferase involved in cellulose biosynthesis
VKLGNFTAVYEGRLSKRSRGTLERKERKLAESSEIIYGWAETSDEKLALLDTFFAQKSMQLAAMGVKNIFDARARPFYREIALLDGDNPSRLRLGYLRIGHSVLATFSGTLCHNRLGIALSSLAEDERQRQSPGALLLKHQIKEASTDGIAFYDIGVGQARHKDEWCDVVQPLFDMFVTLRPQGLLLTLPLATITRLKRAIKSSRSLWPLMLRLRRSIFGRDT